jgi:hypothetical protein
MQPSCLLGRLGVICWPLLLSVATAISTAAATYFVSPAGGGNGSSTNAPAKGSAEQLNLWLRSTNADHLDLTIVFLPGSYPLVRTNDSLDWLVMTGGTNRSVTLCGQLAADGSRPKLVMGTTTYASNPWPGEGAGEHILISTAPTAVGNDRNYLGRVVVENLELDGNWDAHGWRTQGAADLGYKTSGLKLWARTGRCRNLLLRNFGASGVVPISFVDSVGAGTESFPLMIYTYGEGQSPLEGDAAPWLIESVEITDLRFRHGGYCTALMPLVLVPNGETNTSPVCLVRRCVVRGVSPAIASGTAGIDANISLNGSTNLAGYKKSGRITFEDNIFLNAATGLNTDTGAVGPLVWANNAVFDAAFAVNLGTANAGLPAHIRYDVNNNLIRMRGRLPYRNYADGCATNSTLWGSDPNLGLGRWSYYPAAGIKVQGVASNIAIGNNRFTTWPASQFSFELPGQATNAPWTPIWVLANDTFYSCNDYARYRLPAGKVDLWNNLLSTTALDFTGTNQLGTFNLTQLLTNSAPAYTSDRLALTNLPTGFVPLGRVERQFARWGNVTNTNSVVIPRLKAVQEVHIGQTSFTNGTLTVLARAVEHRTPAFPGQGSAVLTNGTVLWLSNRIELPGGTVWTTNLSAVLGANGLATFTLNNLVGLQGLCQLSVWLDAPGSPVADTAAAQPTNMVPTNPISYDPPVVRGPWNPRVQPNRVRRPGIARAAVPAWIEKREFPAAGGTLSGTLEPDADAWASGTFALGTVVELTATPDVADDKNTAAAKRAKLILTRSGNSAASLTVSLSLPTGTTQRPNGTDLTAAYGSAGDYTLSGGGWTATNSLPVTGGTVTFPAGTNRIEVAVVPVADNKWENNLIVAQLLTSPNYALSPSNRLSLLIYDGPYWTVSELNLDSQGTTTNSLAYAVNDASSAQATGWGSYWYSTGGSPPYALGTLGGYWTSSTYNYLNPLYASTYYGLSTSPVKLAGVDGNYAVLASPGGAWSQLTRLSTNNPSGAWGINSNATQIAGYSPNAAGLRRAVVWPGGGTPLDLLGSDGDATGEARAVNVSNVVAGFTTGFFNSSTAQRGFRTVAGTGVTTLTPNDDLPPPSGSNGTNATSSFALSQTGIAVGTHMPNLLGVNWGGYWPLRASNEPNALAVSLGVWAGPVLGGEIDNMSSAQSVNSAGAVVGWSGANSTQTRAVYRTGSGSSWRDLNDKHFVHGISGWQLERANSINGNGVIVGNGKLSGTPRGFILTPRTTGN